MPSFTNSPNKGKRKAVAILLNTKAQEMLPLWTPPLTPWELNFPKFQKKETRDIHKILHSSFINRKVSFTYQIFPSWVDKKYHIKSHFHFFWYFPCKFQEWAIEDFSFLLSFWWHQTISVGFLHSHIIT